MTHDLEHDFHFNTAISAVMELVNALTELERVSLRTLGSHERAALLREGVETVLLLLGPVCPHMTEELWSALTLPGKPGETRGADAQPRFGEPSLAGRTLGESRILFPRIETRATA